MLLQGILLGISLSFLVGPLMFAIVEAGIGQGFRAGVAVAGGIWVSDMLYVLAAFYGVDAMEALVALPHFRMWAGLVGGLLLTGFGLGTLWKARKPIKLSGSFLEGAWVEKPDHKTYLWWWLRGFLLNSVNPGTVFFWLGITTAVVVPSGWSRQEMLIFFGGMMGTLVFTDILKAWAAKRLRRFLTPVHIRQIQRGLGILMIVFGVVLIVKMFLE
ncbi:MAG: LysE family transporter [Saprospiraceae bacterium]|nr:LysE family transporter [Saprospiraceae bacterium]